MAPTRYALREVARTSGPEQGAGRLAGEQRPVADRAQVQPLLDQEDQDGGGGSEGQVQQPDQDRHSAQHALAGQPAEALGQLPAYLPDRPC